MNRLQLVKRVAKFELLSVLFAISFIYLQNIDIIFSWLITKLCEIWLAPIQAIIQVLSC